MMRVSFIKLHQIQARAQFIPSLRAFSTVKSTNPLLAPQDKFQHRHIGPSKADASEMLRTVGVADFETLISKAVPKAILSEKPFESKHEYTHELSEHGLSESEALATLKSIASTNQLHTNFLGQGYYGTLTPGVILRNMLENPAWYTAYTPYQSEVSQGRLEMLLNFQTMVKDLTQMDIANCSLLDEGSAAAEAMSMAHAVHRSKRSKFFVSENLFKQSIGCIATKAECIGVELVIGDEDQFIQQAEADPNTLKEFSGAIVQYPDKTGRLKDFSQLSDALKQSKCVFTIATDLLALTLHKSPGKFDADIVVGSSQRFGVPLFYGGPHAAYMAVKEKLTRLMPGRLIGVSQDANGDRALRMALQTREQFIKREKATSNICTAQALLANVAAAYGIYHGPEGLVGIAESVKFKARCVAAAAEKLGFSLANGPNEVFFDTVTLKFDDVQSASGFVSKALQNSVNVFDHQNGMVGISVDETTTVSQINEIISTLSDGQHSDLDSLDLSLETSDPAFEASPVKRSPGDKFMQHPVFNSHHSETKLLRYLSELEAKDLTLRNSMIPLGSCTMKLNATSELQPISWPEFSNVHPFVPRDQIPGYTLMIDQLNDYLAKVTGFKSVSSQPNSGATGEFAGLLAIKKFHESRGDSHRDVCLIPTSAHGTNPASAVMAGMKVVGVKNDKSGAIDLVDLKAKAEKFKDRLSCIMITYPSTYGVFDEDVLDIIKLVKDNGGRIYMDGANMNAQLGITSPGYIGADVCHLNLHKTFAIPHGGGGPGVGSIGVSAELEPFLPSHNVVPIHDSAKAGVDPIGQVAAAPFGSAGILPISWMFVSMLGKEGLMASGKFAILAANYMAKELSQDYNILFLNKDNTCAHEFILDLRYLSEHGLSEGDVAKRLADYGFHAPTMSWPVAGTMMIEPTESESKDECDRMIQALRQIKKEINDVVEGRVNVNDSVLRNAPHSMDCVLNEATWNKVERGYTREEAAFPAEFVRGSKVWPSARVDNVFGDRNLICSCESVEELESKDLK